MVSEARRQIGGQSNRKGNRYEDAFAVFRSIQLAPDVIHLGRSVRLREQAGCRVDDLLIREESRRHYYQLKDHKTIAWGWKQGELREDFIAQMEQCKSRQEDFTLTVVVSHDHRKQLLDDSMPDELKGAATVYHFPAVHRPSELAQRETLHEPLGEVSASRRPGPALLQGLVEGFHLAWVGHLEWSWGPRESGLVEQPCDSESFRRFVDRVRDGSPATFEEFETLLP